MLSEETIKKLSIAIGSDDLADEISARLINVTPRTKSEAMAILDILDASQDMSDNINTVLRSKLDNSCGREISNKVNGCVETIRAMIFNKNIDDAKGEMGNAPMSTDTFETLSNHLRDRKAAEEFRQAYNKMVETIQEISL